MELDLKFRSKGKAQLGDYELEPWCRSCRPTWWGLAMRLPNPGAVPDNAAKSMSSDPIHDFAWHRQHRSLRRIRWVDIAMIAAWSAFVGWMLLRH
jgi:hypothetical protein